MKKKNLNGDFASMRSQEQAPRSLGWRRKCRATAAGTGCCRDRRSRSTPTTDFEKTVIGGVKAQGKQIKTLADKMGEVTRDLGNATSETKKAFEELSKVHRRKTPPSHGEKLLALQKTQMQVGREVHLNWGNPAERIAANEVARLYVNSFIRSKISKFDDTIRVTDAMQKALGEGSGEGAGWLLPEIAAMIYEALPNYGIWSTLGVEAMGTKQKILTVSTADPIAYVIPEGGVINDDTNMAGATVTANAAKIAVLLNVSRELLQDSEYDVTARVVKQFLRAVAKRMDYLAFMANGTNDNLNGAFTGLFNFGTVVTAASGHTAVESFTFEDVYGAVLGVAEAILDRQARWWMHPFMLVRALSIKDGNGRPIFLNALEAPTPGGLGSILGYPVTLGHILPTTNTAGQPVCAFGDPEAYAVGRRQDYEFDFSDHARWTNDQRSFRGISRGAFLGRLATGLTILTTASS